METRAEIISRIAQASLGGNLGYFIGTGFSIALTTGTARPAPNWTSLLRELVSPLNEYLARLNAVGTVELPAPEDAYGTSAAALASSLCRDFGARLLTTSEFSGVEPSQVHAAAKLAFKFEIARLCAFSPQLDYQARVAAALRVAQPKWIVTTNYDVLIEELVPDSASLHPQQPIVHRPNSVPVYHLHGHRRDPASVVILEEDYHALLLTQEYRHARLAVAFSESLTVLLGYSLGDVNVQLALKSAVAFDLDSEDSNAGKVIQAVYAPMGGDPSEVDGLTILPISDVASFLEEVARACTSQQTADADHERAWEQYFEQAKDEFVANAEHRRRSMPHIIRRAETHAERTTAWLDEALTPVLQKAREDGGFNHYGTITTVLLDLLAADEFKSAHPALFAWAYGWLAIVATMITEDPGRQKLGDSWAATRVWHERKADISADVLALIRARAEREHQPWVLRLV